MPLKLEPVDSALRFEQVAASQDHAIRPSTFVAVIENLIKNPNITSSHLFRADVLYDSAADASYDASATTVDAMCRLARHMQPKFQPRLLDFVDLKRRRTVIREMIPRNPNRDARLAQTCHFYEASTASGGAVDDTTGGSSLVVYLPHADQPASIPWYHPPVAAVAFLLEWQPDEEEPKARLSISVARFESDAAVEDPERLKRTIQNLLTTITRHCMGRQAGYTKHVQLDRLVPQARTQDTYTRLKGSYAKALTQGWQESTDPSKHVFEDLCIAAFLMELWRDLYKVVPPVEDNRRNDFKGFVDIGCGNGLLVHILRSEGYEGWGFDIRERKSWSAYPSSTSDHLKVMTLVPSVFGERDNSPDVHNGVFPKGTFIVSNHADELTAWTPLLARMSGRSPFLAIPCCSHDLGGTRTRFKPREGWNLGEDGEKRKDVRQPSAYATLCDYLKHMTEAVSYVANTEILRIPSTRNVAIFGHPKEDLEPLGNETEMVVSLIEQEMGSSLETVANAWWERAEKIRKSKGSGH